MVTKTELDGLLRTLQAKYDKTIQEIGERLSSVEKENVNLMKQVWELLENQSKPIVWPVVGKVNIPETMNIINSVAKESKEREKRENNVVIFGVVASTNTDQKKEKEENKIAINKVLNKLQIRVNIENIIKLKSKSDKDNEEKRDEENKVKSKDKEATFKVVLKDREERDLILKKAKELRDSKEYGNLFINPYQTQAERYKSKLLRDEPKEKNADNKEKDKYYYGIRNDKVVKIFKKYLQEEDIIYSNQDNWEIVKCYEKVEESSGGAQFVQTSLGDRILLEPHFQENMQNELKDIFDLSKEKEKEKKNKELKIWYTNATSLRTIK